MMSKDIKNQKLKKEVSKTIALLDNYSIIEEKDNFKKIMALNSKQDETFNFTQYFFQYSKIAFIAIIIILNIISTYITMNANNKQTTSKSYVTSLTNHYNLSSIDYINNTKEK